MRCDVLCAARQMLSLWHVHPENYRQRAARHEEEECQITTMWRVRRPLYIRLVGARTLARCALRDAPQARQWHAHMAAAHLRHA